MSMEQSHGDPGGFDPAQIDNGGWDNSFIDSSLDSTPFPFGLSSDLGGNVDFPSHQALADHQGLSNPVAGPEYGNYPSQYMQSSPHLTQGTPAASSYSPQQLASSYHQPALHFDVGHPSHIQAGGSANGVPQSGFAAGRGTPFNLPQNGYGQVASETQPSWPGPAGGQMVNGYHSHPSYTNIAGPQHQQLQQPHQPQQPQPQHHQQPPQHQQQPPQHQQQPPQHQQQPPQHQQLRPQSQLEQQPHLREPTQSPSPRVPQQVPQKATQQASQQPTQQILPQQVSPRVHQQAQPQALPHSLQPLSKVAPVVSQAVRPVESTPAIQDHAGLVAQQHAPPQVTGTFQAPTSKLTVPDPYLRVDENLSKLKEAGGPSWVGAKHLVIDPAPESREKIPRQQMIPVHLRSDKRRLFSERSFPIPSESLGMHLDGRLSLLKTPNDDPTAARAKRDQLDAILVQAMKRDGQKEVPDKWKARVDAKIKEELKKFGQNGAIQNESDLPADKIREVESEAAAILHIPSGWQLDPTVIARVTDDFCAFLRTHSSALRTTSAYKELPKAIRENLRNPSPAIEEQVRTLRAKVDPLRKAVERIVVAALENGDPRILRRVGEKNIIVSPLFQTAINCINTEEPNSPLVKAVLRLFTYFADITTPQLEECKLIAARPKLQELGDDEVKSHLEKILAMAKENDAKVDAKPTKPSSEPSAAPKPSSTGVASKAGKATAKAPVGSKATPGPTSSKRPRDEDNELRASKKVATEAKATGPNPPAKPLASKNSSQPGPATLGKPRASTGLLPGKSRPPAKPAQKPESMKTGQPKLDRARTPTSSDSPPASGPSKSEAARPRAPQPTPSAAAAAAVAEAAKVVSKAKKLEPSKAEAAQQGPSRFAALMAEIDEPEQAKPSAPTSTRSPDLNETPEEKERRLKKEKRRRLNLRVSWKEGDELTSVRVFHKEAAEDEGREVNMIRDANDDRAEGKLLKQSRSGEIRPWEELSLINFSKLPQERQEGNFVTRGGSRTFHTDQQKFMEEREMRELMVVYTDPSDIPATPKSPAHQPADLPGPEGVAHDPPMTYPWDGMRERAQDVAQYGPMEAGRRLFQRFEEAKRGSAADRIGARAREMMNDPANAQRNADPVARDNEVSNLIQGLSIRNWQDPEPHRPVSQRVVFSDAKIQEIFDNIAAITKSLKDKPAVPQEPPDWQKDPERRAEWVRGYNHDKQLKEERDRQEAARQAAAQPPQAALGNGFGHYGNPAYSQSQNSYSQYYPAAQPGQASVPQQAATVHNDQVAALLAAYGATPQQAAQSTTVTDGTRALLAALNQGQQPSQAPPPTVPGIPNMQDPNQAHLILAQMLASQANQGAQGGHTAGEAYSYGSSLHQGNNNNNNNAQYAGAPHGYGQDAHPSRHQRDVSDPSARAGQGNRGRDRGGHGGRRGQGSAPAQGDTPEHLRNINRSLIGTKQCTFFLRGQCAKGDTCTFRHSYT